eukprot:COSAG01_NODE_29676_length_632_cov_1.082552_1_plen_75_part_10
MTRTSRYNSRDPARLYGWTDRGTLEVGMRADVNVVRLDRGVIIPWWWWWWCVMIPAARSAAPVVVCMDVRSPPHS